MQDRIDLRQLGLFLLAGTDPIDTGLVGLLGVSGWIVLVAVIVLLVVLRRFPVRAATRRGSTPD